VINLINFALANSQSQDYNKAMSKIIVNLPDEVDNRLTEIALANGISLGDTMQKAFALLSIAERNKSKGYLIGVISDNNGEQKIINTIKGI
jgi:hypothetical protein